MPWDSKKKEIIERAKQDFQVVFASNAVVVQSKNKQAKKKTF